MKTLVLGLGNTILTDDGVGIYVTREIGKLINPVRSPHQRCGIPTFVGITSNGVNGDTSIEIEESSLAGLNLLDLLTGYDKAIIIDSIKTNDTVGKLYRLTPEDLRDTLHTSSPHEINLATALEMGRQMNLELPKEIIIYAINVQCNDVFGERPTSCMERLIPKIAERILSYERKDLH